MKIESGWIEASVRAHIKRMETGWDTEGNCKKCKEAGNCHCKNHHITGFKREGKPVRIVRVPFTSEMFKRYSPDKKEIYHATGQRLNAVGSFDFIMNILEVQP